MNTIRVLSLTVGPDDQPIFSEMHTVVSIVEEAAGEFVEVSQAGRTDLGKIAIDPSEWPTLREAIDRMIADCRGYEGEQTK